MTIQGIFIGEGQALSADVSGEKGSVGTGFRKKAAR